MVKSIHPFATKYAILKTKDEIEGVLLKGFDSTYDFNHLQAFIKKEDRCNLMTAVIAGRS